MDEVLELLTTWGLSELAVTFLDNEITLEALAALTPDTIKELIPKVGQRVLFLRCWRVWFAEYAGKESTDDVSLVSLDISATALEVFNDKQSIGTGVVYDLTPALSEPGSSSTQSQTTQESGILQTLLAENLETAGLLVHAGDSLPGDSARNLLASVIAKEILQKFQNTSIRGELYYKWCSEIKNLFPGERSTTYYIPACKTANGTTLQARGKLVNQILNTRKRFQRHGVLAVKAKKSRESSPLNSTYSCPSPRPLPATFSNEPDEINTSTSVEEDITWLKHSSDPWYIVEEKWKRTCEHRIRNLHAGETGPTIEKYVNDFPALKTPLGYCLLEHDFEVAYPNHTKKLLLNFPLLKTNIIGLLKQRKTKDNFYTEIAELADHPDEEVTNIVAFMAIPLLLRSSVSFSGKRKTNKSWKPTKVEARDAFITHIRNNEIQETIHRRKQKLMDKGFSPQPFCMIIGPSLTEITTFLIVVNDCAVYERTNILAAVDTCFKAIWALNAEYSFDSYATWYFIQRGLYKLTSQFDKGSTAAESLLSDCKITL